MANDTASWMPNILANVLAGAGTDVSTPAALAALATWALVPAGDRYLRRRATRRRLASQVESAGSLGE